MRNTLPEGKAALSISQAGHEIALHGFLDKAKPYIFIMTDGSGKNRGSRMAWMHKYFMSIYPENTKDMYNILVQGNLKGEDRYIKGWQVFQEIILKQVAFFAHYAGTVAEGLVRHKIDYIVTEAIEGNDPLQDFCAIVTEVAVKLVEEKTAKKIDIYQYHVTEKFDKNINDDSIRIELSDESYNAKIKAIANYHESIFEEFKANIGMDVNSILKMKEMPRGILEVENVLKSMDATYFKEEYISPYQYVDFNNNDNKPAYETNGEKALAEGLPTQVITYDSHIKLLKEVLEKVALTPKQATPAIN